MSEFLVERAEQEIYGRYGDKVSVLAKSKSLLKFGRNDAVGTSYETVWSYGGDETYVTTNAIDTVSSSDAADDAVIVVEGHTVTGTGADTQFAFVIQTVTVDGRNKVPLVTPVARVSRAYVTSGTLDGDFYVYEDDTLSNGVPNTAAKVHLYLLGSEDEKQTYKCATTFSNSDYGILTGVYVGINKKTNASADYVVEVRTPGGFFRPVTGRISLDTSAQTAMQKVLNPYIIIPKNSDIRIRAIASTTNVSVDASFQCYLALVI